MRKVYCSFDKWFKYDWKRLAQLEEAASYRDPVFNTARPLVVLASDVVHSDSSEDELVINSTRLFTTKLQLSIDFQVSVMANQI